MSAVIFNQGEPTLLNWMLKSTSNSEDLKVRLFSNNVDLSSDLTSADITTASFPGYADATLHRSSWESAAEIGGLATAVYGNEIEWIVTGSTTESIYGYVIMNSDASLLLFGANFLDIKHPSGNGDIIRFLPALTLQSANE